MQSEELRALGRALACLDPSSRELLELRYFGDCSYAEIARSLAIRPKTARSRLKRTMHKLQQIFQSLLEQDAASRPSRHLAEPLVGSFRKRPKTNFSSISFEVWQPRPGIGNGRPLHSC